MATFLLIVTWSAYAAQLFALDDRARIALATRAGREDIGYANDVAARLDFIASVLNFVASYDAQNGISKTARLVERNRLYRGLDANILIVDLQGKGRFAGPSGVGAIDIGDRPHFRAAMKDHSGDLTIGRPVIGRLRSKLTIPFARAVRRADGTLLGVVSTAVNSNAFTAAFDEGDIGRHGVLSMFDVKSGALLSRYTIAGERIPGDRSAFATFRSRVQAAHSANYWMVSPFDHFDRAISYRTLDRFPIVVIAALAYADVAPQNADVRRNLFFVSLASSLVILVVLAFWFRQLAVQRELYLLNARAEGSRSEAEEANRAKSEFLANMSHEIRTPMNGVIGLTYLALKSNPNDKQRNFLQKINTSATLLLGIINDILDISKIEAGKIEIEEVPFNLKSVIETVTNIAAVRAEEKGLSFRVTCEDGVPTDLMGDPMRLGQVLINIVGNATKFTERGEVALTVSAGGSDSNSGRVPLHFEIRDTGIGMDEAQLSRLFAAFSQGDSSVTRRFGGTGLGLAISKAFVELMGGTIDVKSAPGVGTTFTVSVVLKQSGPLATAAAALSTLGRRRVLVVEDNPVDRDILSDLLRSWSLDVATASSGSEALHQLTAAESDDAPIDLVVMDWQMPGTDGVEVTRLINGAGLAACPTIIMVTAHARESVMRSAEAAGIAALIVKPVNPSLLLDAVSSAFGANAAADVNLPSDDGGRLDGLHVLVAEDNAINEEIIVNLLEAAGATVVCVPNGRLAVSKVLDGGDAYDVVLMDVQMPELDGVAATREIRARVPASRLPIIAMTAHAMDEERQRCIAAGMNDHIAKPIDPPAMTATIRRWSAKSVVPPSTPANGPSQVASALASELPAFEIAAALARCNGNEVLLRRLFLRFIEEFGDVPNELRRAVEAGRARDAMIVAHTVAGSAGQLGATAAASAARDLERALRDGDGREALSLLLPFATVFNATLVALRNLQPSTLPVAARPAQPDIGPALVDVALRELGDLLAKNHLRAIKVFEGVRSSFAGTDAEDAATRLAAQLEVFDFPGASQTLRDIVALRATSPVAG